VARACTPGENFEGFVRAASKEKWLEYHALEHWTHFYTDYGHELQKRFFDFYFKGKANDWTQQPKVQLQVRHIDRFVERHETDWPLPATVWTKFYLDPRERTLSLEPPAAETEISFAAMGDGLTFISRPLTEETEITGPLSAGLLISSSTEDADVFVVFRVLVRTFARSRLSVRSIHTRRWRRAGYVLRIASLTRPCRARTVPTYPRRSSAVAARQAGQSCHRDMAHVDRRPQGL
jgi:predicted acyl esterase